MLLYGSITFFLFMTHPCPHSCYSLLEVTDLIV